MLSEFVKKSKIILKNKKFFFSYNPNKNYLQDKFKTMTLKKIKIVFILSLFIFSCSKEVKKSNKSINDFFETINEDATKYNKTNDIKNKTTFSQIESKKNIKIATILPLSGAYSDTGKEGIDVVNMFKDSKVSIHIFDTGSNPENIPLSATDIKNNDFDVIVGPIFNYETEKLAEIETQKPIISLSNDSTISRQNVITFGLNQEEKIIDAVSFFANREMVNFITLLPNSTNGSRVYKSLKNTIHINSGNLMRAEFYDKTGISGVSKYVQKVLNGITEKTYTSNATGEALSERQIKLLQEKNPSLDLNDYTIKETKADVIFVLGSSDLEEIVSILNEQKNQNKLKDVIVLFLDSDLTKIKYNGYGAFYEEGFNEAYFQSAFEVLYNKKPSKLSSVLHDAISYSIYVNNNTLGGLEFVDLKRKYSGFEGINGSFMVRENNSLRRLGKVVTVNDFDIEELIEEMQIKKNAVKSNDVKNDENNNKVNHSINFNSANDRTKINKL